jgi:hypothetical protein
VFLFPARLGVEKSLFSLDGSLHLPFIFYPQVNSLMKLRKCDVRRAFLFHVFLGKFEGGVGWGRER